MADSPLLTKFKGEIAKTKLIKDIWLFELVVPNIDDNSTPHYIGKIYPYDHMECLDLI